MGQFGFGQSVTRVEDQRLLSGHGRYTDDISLPRQAHGFVLRSPHAHARIDSLDIAAATAMPGVLGVFVAADLDADGVGPIPCLAPVKNVDGSAMARPPHPVLASGTVRHVGDPVAFVVAETLAQARDAAEAVVVDYMSLPAIADLAAAVEDGAPQVWDEAANNVCFTWEIGDAAAAEAGFAKAARVTKLRLVNNRIVVNPMEPRAAIGAYDSYRGRYELHSCSQGAHGLRGQLANNIFKLPLDQVRVITPDVGGGFGMKIFLYAEYVLALWAAKRLDRPVKWTSSRGEAFLSDTQGRDNITEVELALDGDGRFLAMRAATLANMGAYLSNMAPFIPTAAGAPMLPGCYRIPAVHARIRGVFTNTVPVDAYRGAGRPEAAFVIERLVDAAAAETGLAPDEIRRRNFIAPDDMPYATATGQKYDSGDFATNMADAMARAGWADFESRRAEAAGRGKLRGIGMAYYIEKCSGGGNESAQVRFDPGGSATILIGTQSNGQGHETAYAQILADELDMPLDRIRVMQGDTDLIVEGKGTGGSRSVPVGAVAVKDAVAKIVAKGKHIAAAKMEAAEADIEFAEGAFTIAGTDKTMTLDAVVKLSFQTRFLPEGAAPGMDETGDFQPRGMTFPNGCHICEVEIDRDTGATQILRYTVVDDFGRMLNPALVAGQVHGGVAQGIGQALLEGTVYDTESGQLLSGSFMDYTMPRASDFPEIDFSTNEVPCLNNPMGMKGAGEAGAIGATPAAINAVVDALKDFGVRDVEMPATPERVWRLIHGAGTA